MSKFDYDCQRFGSYAVGAQFLEMATPGAFPPGVIAADPVDGAKALMFTGQWMTIKDSFQDIRNTPTKIHVDAEIRFLDPRGQLNGYLFDGNSSYNGFASLEVFAGNIYFSVYNTEVERMGGKSPLGSILCGPYDERVHTIGMVFGEKLVSVRFDGQEQGFPLGILSARPVDSLRIRSIGRTIEAGKTIPCLLIRDLHAYDVD